ncbi:hypothetical protein GOP47_0002504 [Adiantum capillus-veneris]|uniref:Uncharacterized protein n=1 Tax=Adiantum capillus-veneris TaxID=13818 RepID=A0A9D4VBQ3_ADICA|nr:hypothetical protein GOP47_0002504 [Adiantum capillus-veneris]
MADPTKLFELIEKIYTTLAPACRHVLSFHGAYMEKFMIHQLLIGMERCKGANDDPSFWKRLIIRCFCFCSKGTDHVCEEYVAERRQLCKVSRELLRKSDHGREIIHARSAGSSLSTYILLITFKIWNSLSPRIASFQIRILEFSSDFWWPQSSKKRTRMKYNRKERLALNIKVLYRTQKALAAMECKLGFASHYRISEECWAFEMYSNILSCKVCPALQSH